MIGKAEWFTGLLTPSQFEEAKKIIELAHIPERVQKACDQIQDDISSFPFSTKWNTSASFGHWSRGWEYPWIIENGNFQKKDDVLDVGGGGSILTYRIGQLVNPGRILILDPDPRGYDKIRKSITHERHGENVVFAQGYGEHIPFTSNYWNKVVCASVLEHCKSPRIIVDEMLRVLKPGGRLIVTMDISDHIVGNYNIDINTLGRMLQYLGLKIDLAAQTAVAVEDVIPTYPGGKDKVSLRVVGFYMDKPL